MIEEIQKLEQEKKYDYILIESTGISEPLPVAMAFYVENQRENHSFLLNDIARLDTMITVVDSFNFEKNLKSMEKVIEVVEKEGQEH